MGNSDLTPGQVAALLGVSPSTLRLWSSKFGHFLSPTAQGGAGSKRRYTPADLATLERVQTLLAGSKSFEDVDRLLGVAPEAAQPTGGALVTLPRLAADLQRAIDLIRQQALEIDRLREAQETTAHDHEQAIAALRDEQEKQAQQHAADLDQARAEHGQAIADLREAHTQEAEHHAGALATAQAEQAQAIGATRQEVARMLDRQHKQRQAQEAEIAGLRSEIDRLKAEQAARRSWLDRLLGRKPTAGA